MDKLYVNSLSKKAASAFTLIEIMVAVSIIAILSSVALVSYNTWQENTYISAIKSDASNVASAMENARNFNSTGYPSAVSAVYDASHDVVVSGGSSDGGKTYCVDLYYAERTSLQYYIDSYTSKLGAQVGTCATRTGMLAAPTNFVAATGSTTTVSLNFNTVSGATGYSVQQSSNAAFTDARTIASLGASPSLPYIVSSLSPNTNYYFRVQTVKASVVSSWSSIASARTSDSQLATPSTPVVTRTSNATTSTFSWTDVSCDSGYSVRYQYLYDVDPISYNSGWRPTVAGSNSLAFTTTQSETTYSISVKAQCYNNEKVSLWSAYNTISYIRPILFNMFSMTNSTPCAISNSNNKAYCWGQNSQWQVGNGGSNTTVATPSLVSFGTNTVKQITTGGLHNCAITASDAAYCWGYNIDGQVGDNTKTVKQTPVAVYTAGVLNGLTIKQISAGSSHTCAIASNDLAYCWGDNAYGELGNYSTTDSAAPVAVYTSGVLSGLKIKSISAGMTHTCAIASDNNAYCWGGQNVYATGAGQATVPTYPVAVTRTGALSGLTIKSISAGQNDTCVIASNGKAYCWGNNQYGELGINNTTGSNAPVAVNTSGVLNGLTLKSISTKWDVSCAIASDDKAYCWGLNGTYGAVGNNTTANSLVPAAVYTSGVLNGLTVQSLSNGNGNNCVIASNNNLYCWGYSFATYLVPAAVTFSPVTFSSY